MNKCSIAKKLLAKWEKEAIDFYTAQQRRAKEVAKCDKINKRANQLPINAFR